MRRPGVLAAITTDAAASARSCRTCSPLRQGRWSRRWACSCSCSWPGTADREFEARRGPRQGRSTPSAPTRAEFYAFFLFSPHRAHAVRQRRRPDLALPRPRADRCRRTSWSTISHRRATGRMEAGVKYFFLGALGAGDLPLRLRAALRRDRARPTSPRSARSLPGAAGARRDQLRSPCSGCRLRSWGCASRSPRCRCTSTRRTCTRARRRRWRRSWRSCPRPPASSRSSC